jgi:hypothetical protein
MTTTIQELRAIERHLERTTWARGIYVEGRVVPAARPGQIRAGARKILDQRRARARRQAKGGAQ